MGRLTAAVMNIGEALAAEIAPPRGGASCGDATLLARFQAGDNTAIVELFDRHNHRLFVYCLKVLGNREWARDTVQELWVRVLRLRLRPRAIDNPVGFFLKIARNLCLNQKSARRPHEPLDALPERQHPSDTGRRPSELEEITLAVLEELPFEYREVLILSIYCGYRLDEIAVMFGKSPDAVWKRASRARKELRKRVQIAMGEQP